MKSWTVVLIVCVAASWCSAQRRDRGRDRERDRGSSSVTTASHSNTGEYSQDYSVFGDLNIFQKDRHARRPANSGGTPPRTPEQTFVLTGIMQDLDNQYRANFEDLSRGGVQKVSVGSALARGTISEIRPDQVAYDAGGKKVWVQIGSNLTGNSATVSESSGGNGGGGGPPIDPNAPGLTIEQRMRARRMQQTSGGSTPAGSPLSTPEATPQSNSPSPMMLGNQRLMGRPPTDSVNGPPAANSPPRGNASDSDNPSGGTGAPTAAPADGDEPVITHNFPALPGEAPTPPQGN